jgi:hypothetical protein
VGILIDTIRMVISFDAMSTTAFTVELTGYLVTLERGEKLEMSHIKYVCGKLNWYSAVLQGGPLHCRAWYYYSTYHHLLSPPWQQQLLYDTNWWVAKLHKWSQGQLTGSEIPIINAQQLLKHPDMLQICVSDMSGPDGLGLYYGALNDSNPRVFSRQWVSAELPLPSTGHGELLALLEYLLRTTSKDCLLVWITDGLVAAFIVNKGTCNTHADVLLLERIFDLADDRRIQIVALWVPRAQNAFADHLSHLALLLNKSEFATFAANVQQPL